MNCEGRKLRKSVSIWCLVTAPVYNLHSLKFVLHVNVNHQFFKLEVAQTLSAEITKGNYDWNLVNESKSIKCVLYLSQFVLLPWGIVTVNRISCEW